MERKKASDFDPQLLSLFHRYVHGGINRREFLDGAAKFAIGGPTGMVTRWKWLVPPQRAVIHFSLQSLEPFTKIPRAWRLR